MRKRMAALVLSYFFMFSFNWVYAEKKEAPRYWSFEKDMIGKVPRDFQINETRGKGKLATWQVIEDLSAPSPPHVFGITKSGNSGYIFNIAIIKGISLTNVDLSVMLRAINGKEDQGGGLIWRVQDENNYYIARWNPLENNFRVYFVKNGRRKQLESMQLEAAANQWHAIRIATVGPHIIAYFDDRKLIEVEDSTFLSSGAVGSWTKADAVTYFDNFSIIPLKQK